MNVVHAQYTRGKDVAKLIILDLHYVPCGHGSPVCPKRSALWDFGHFILCIQVLLGLATFSRGLSRYIRDGPWEQMGPSPVGSNAHYDSARGQHHECPS